MSPEDRQKYIGGLVARGGVSIDPDDPAFELVILNRLMLEDSFGAILDRLERLAQGMPRDIAQAIAGHVLHFDRKIVEMNHASDEAAKILHQIAAEAVQIHTDAAMAAKAKVETDLLASVQTAVQAVVRAELAAASQQIGQAAGVVTKSADAAVAKIEQSSGIGWAAGTEAASSKIFWVAGAGIAGASAMFILIKVLG